MTVLTKMKKVEASNCYKPIKYVILKCNNKKSTYLSMLQKKYLRVVCAIIVHGRQVLTARRAPGQSHGGSWEFPGGKINPGENPQQAIVRELREELAITVSIIKELAPVTHHYESKIVELIPFVCSIEEGTITPVDHDEIQWVDREKVAEVPLLPPDRVIWEGYYLPCSVHPLEK
jgi:8-oxo-dGTP diphosphatase